MSEARPRASAAHVDADGRFRNPWPGSAEHGFGDVLRWAVDRRRSGAAAAAARSARTAELPRAVPAFSTPRAEPGTLGATWVGHSTVLVQLGALNVLTDPIWSERASPLSWLGPRRLVPPGVGLDQLPPVDVVLLSHNHYDHLDAPTVRALAERHPEAHWAAPLGVSSLLRELGVPRVSELDWWDEVSLGTVRVACTPAQHFSARGIRDRRRTLWCGWAVRAGGQALYFAGDTAYHPEFGAIGARFGPFDLALLPIGAYEPRWFMRRVHMNPEEAVRAYQDIDVVRATGRRTAALGIHWGTFRLTDEPIDEPPRRARAAWRAAGLDERDLWILHHGETRASRTQAAGGRQQRDRGRQAGDTDAE